MLYKPEPHVEKLLKLADFLDALEPERFSMKTWGQVSEPRCICGWFMHNEGHVNKDAWVFAGEQLGMDEDMAAKFFQQSLHRAEQITPRHAARALRHYAVTGEFSGW